MPDRLLVTDASTTTGADFLRRVFNRPPLTEAEKANRIAKDAAFAAEQDAKHQREMIELRERLEQAKLTLRRQHERDMEAVRMLSEPVEGDPLRHLEPRRAA